LYSRFKEKGATALRNGLIWYGIVTPINLDSYETGRRTLLSTCQEKYEATCYFYSLLKSKTTTANF
ncbi:MAG TPA: hypothetical protein VMC44_05925, partial [Geobacteraceae bacterium]|nr:hypothetical protein [Geobacteraceae bacterium]